MSKVVLARAPQTIDPDPAAEGPHCPLCYIYALCEPDSGWPRYVGATQDMPRQRWQEHYGNRKAGRTRKDTWLCTLADNNLRPALRILAVVHAGRARSAELYWISVLLRAGCPLLNNPGDCARCRKWPSERFLADMVIPLEC